MLSKTTSSLLTFPENDEEEVESVVFIFLSDGPLDDKSFRPKEDETMHWARRDALVRITAQSLYGNVACQHACFLFHEEDVADPSVSPLLAVLSMYGPELSTIVNLPTEYDLLKQWKEASTYAIQNPQQASISTNRMSSQQQRKKTLPGQKLSIVAPPRGLECSFTPWREAILLRYAGAGIETFSSTGSISAVAAASTSSSSSSGTFDKRVILRSLQQQCPVDFLRTHGLLGSEELVLKKKNKESILSAHREWTMGTSMETTASSSSSNNNNSSGGSKNSSNPIYSNNNTTADNAASIQVITGKKRTLGDTTEVTKARTGSETRARVPMKVGLGDDLHRLTQTFEVLLCKYLATGREHPHPNLTLI